MEAKRPVFRGSIHFLFTKLSKPIERGNTFFETGRTKTRSSDDSKSLNVEMAHDRTGQPVVETQRMYQKVPKHIRVMKAGVSTLETKQLVIERRNPL